MTSVNVRHSRCIVYNCPNEATIGRACNRCWQEISANASKPKIAPMILQVCLFVIGMALFCGVLWLVGSVTVRVLQ